MKPGDKQWFAKSEIPNPLSLPVNGPRPVAGVFPAVEIVFCDRSNLLGRCRPVSFAVVSGGAGADVGGGSGELGSFFTIILGAFGSAFRLLQRKKKVQFN